MNITTYRKLPYPLNLWSTVLDREVTFEDLPADYEETLRSVLHDLKSVEQECILLYFRDDLSLSEIGDKRHLSRARISQILQRAFRKLKYPARKDCFLYGRIKAVEMREQAEQERLSLNAKKQEEWEAFVKEHPEKLPIAKMNISTRSMLCLSRAGLHTAADILALSEEELLNIDTLGRKSGDEILHALESLHLIPERKTEDFYKYFRKTIPLSALKDYLYSVDRMTQDEILALSVSELGLSIRAYNCLLRAKIYTISDLIHTSKTELKKTPYLGVKCFDEILDALNTFHFTLAEK